MGANATTSVPVYASGEVLTAADLNITNSGIPVFADSTARDNSFGGTGEKTLAEGQFAFLEDSNSTQFYDGAVWQGIGGGMTLLSTTTLTGASTTVSGIDQTYNALEIYITNAFSSTAAGYVRCYINGNSTSGNYNSSYQRFRAGSTQTNDDTFAWSGWPWQNSTNNSMMAVTLPNYTSAHRKTWFSYGYGITDNGNNGGFFGNGGFNNNAAITSLQFINNGGSWSSGTVLIYGVK